jgi:hypothetical protein
VLGKILDKAPYVNLLRERFRFPFLLDFMRLNVSTPVVSRPPESPAAPAVPYSLEAYTAGSLVKAVIGRLRRKKPREIFSYVKIKINEFWIRSRRKK